MHAIGLGRDTEGRIRQVPNAISGTSGERERLQLQIVSFDLPNVSLFYRSDIANA